MHFCLRMSNWKLPSKERLWLRDTAEGGVQTRGRLLPSGKGNRQRRERKPGGPFVPGNPGKPFIPLNPISPSGPGLPMNGERGKGKNTPKDKWLQRWLKWSVVSHLCSRWCSVTSGCCVGCCFPREAQQSVESLSKLCIQQACGPLDI